ncbi:MAG: hypothetical protein HC913_17015, partial [Microscillaceae bacterium]|nr:hypothetical protein [Microscillaceae bacterium]
MKKYFVFWISGLAFSVVQAQDPCQVSIPSEAEAIFRSPLAEKTARDQAYWICNGAKVVFRSGNGLIFAERGTKVTVRFGTYTIYLKAGAELILGTRSETLVYYEGPLNVQRPAFNFQESYTNCPNLVFDYSQAPATDCAREEEPPLPENPVVEVPQNPYPSTFPPADAPPARPEVNDFDTLPPPVPDDQHIIPPQVQVVPYGNPLITATARQQTY